jgi:hypothetical protein
MINTQAIRLSKFSYNNIYIVENRNQWEVCSSKCDKEYDLILCVDFALKNELQLKKYNVAFLDHIVENTILDDINTKMHDFLRNWSKDELGNNTLTYDGFDLGNALLITLINDVSYFCHFFFNIYALKSIKYEQLFVATDDETILSILNKLELDYVSINLIGNSNQVVYAFPIAKWVDEAINNTTWKKKLKIKVSWSLDRLTSFLDIFSSKEKKHIYVQAYHPTYKIIDQLSKNSDIQLVFPDYYGIKEKNVFKQRRVRYNNDVITVNESNAILLNYKKAKKYRWEYEGYNISDYLYEIINTTVEKGVANAIPKANSIKKYFDKHPLHLMIPVTDLWIENMLIMNYCNNNKIPVYFIANGLLNVSYSNDGKFSDYVNCYSESCKEDYFKNASNVFALGDPRMDKYSNVEPKPINRKNPVIVIGAAGYCVADINSYLAYEFDFLYDVLSSIKSLNNIGYQADIVLKVRANGYSHLYQSFVKEYFPNFEVRVIQNLAFYEVVKLADLYISIYSQTIFEASCLGIPVIYYKKDTQAVFRPFDRKSELVTAYNIENLTGKIKLFYSDMDDYFLFKKKEVLEKYIGPLDGNNLKTNIDFIENLLNKSA